MQSMHDEEDTVARVRKLAGDARQVASEAGDVAAQVGQAGRAQIEAHPYGTLLGAALAGYVLGGGLAAPLTGQLVRLGARLFLAGWLRGSVATHPAMQMELPH